MICRLLIRNAARSHLVISVWFWRNRFVVESRRKEEQQKNSKTVIDRSRVAYSCWWGNILAFYASFSFNPTWRKISLNYKCWYTPKHRSFWAIVQLLARYIKVAKKGLIEESVWLWKIFHCDVVSLLNSKTSQKADQKATLKPVEQLFEANRVSCSYTWPEIKILKRRLWEKVQWAIYWKQ